MFQKVILCLMVVVFSASMSVASEKGSYKVPVVDKVTDQVKETVGDVKEMLNIGDVNSDVVEEVDTVMAEVDDMIDMEESTSEKGLTYAIDVSHSTIGFAVKHLQVGTTRGAFSDYTGSIHYDPENLASFSADVSIKVDSIDTRNEGRDEHLRNPDFFDTATYPNITFTSNRLEKRGEGHVIVGDLTIRDVTKQLTIPVQISGPVKSPFGSTVMALAAQITINRQDFNVSWSKQLDNGGLVVADLVDLIIEIEAQYKN